MKPSLAAGLTFRRKLSVDRSRTIDFLGDEGRVYATPALVKDIEITCRDGLLDHLDRGEDSVGARVELDHLSPTPVDVPVEIVATIGEVKGRLISFDITARDPVDEIARGRHVRFVVDVQKSAERLKAKLAKLGGAGTL